MSDNFNNEVRNARGAVIGYRCFQCDHVKGRMWGTTCNECRETNRKHDELVALLQRQPIKPSEVTK